MNKITFLFTLALFLTNLHNNIQAADNAPKDNQSEFDPKVHLAVLNEYLREAAQQGELQKVFDLIDQGAEINQSSPRTKDTMVAKLFATGIIDKDTIAQLSDSGADIKKKNHETGTSLLVSLMNGDATPYLTAFLCLVWDFNLKITYRDNQKNTLFHHAAMLKSHFWTTILLGLFRSSFTPIAIKYFLDLKNTNGKTAYQIAQDNNYQSIIQLLAQEQRFLATEIKGNETIFQEEKLKKQEAKDDNTLLLAELEIITSSDGTTSPDLIQKVKRARRNSQPIPVKYLKEHRRSSSSSSSSSSGDNKK
jgi:ankyrin repeat protein